MMREQNTRTLATARPARRRRIWMGIVCLAFVIFVLAACQSNAPSTTAPTATTGGGPAATSASQPNAPATAAPAGAAATTTVAAAPSAAPVAAPTTAGSSSAATPVATSASANGTPAAGAAPTTLAATGTPAISASPTTLAVTPTVQSAVGAAAPSSTPTAAAAAVPQQEGRPMFQMNAQHTGRSPYAGPRSAALLQSYQLPVPAEATPAPPPMDVESEAAIAPDGTIYIGNYPGYLVALRKASSGDQLSLLWRFHPEGASSWHSTPAIGRDGTIYIGFSTGRLAPTAKPTFYALRAPSSGTDAQVVWTVDFGTGRQTSSPVIGPDGTIYAVNAGGKLFAITPDGKVKWTAPSGPNIQASPALGSDGTVYLASMDGKLYAVSPPSSSSAGDGTSKWTFDFTQHLGATPFPTAEGPYPTKQPFGASGIGTLASPTIGPDGTIYVGESNSNMYAITPDGQMKWMFEAEREIAGIASTAAINADGGTLYFGANKGGIYALNTADGTKKWQYPIYGSIDPSPTLDSQGTLYAGSTLGHVFALDAATGRPFFDYNAGASVWTAPAVMPDGSLLVATRKGKVLLLGQSS